jgi:hypothetical protein
MRQIRRARFFSGQPISPGSTNFLALLVPLALASGDYARRVFVFMYPKYEEYLTGLHWDNLRQSAFDRAGRRCESCRTSERLCGHHLRYPDDLTTCTVEDIMCLCERCHDLWHQWLRLNGEQMERYCRESTRGALAVLLILRRVVKPKAVSKHNGLSGEQIKGMLASDSRVKEALRVSTRKEYRKRIRRLFEKHPDKERILNYAGQLFVRSQSAHRFERIEKGFYRA